MRVFELNRAEHVECWVSSLPVLEYLKVFEHGVVQLKPGIPPLVVQQLDLHSCPEGLDLAVVVAVADGLR